MSIYLLKRKEAPGWDEYDAKIVRAPSERDARRIANKSTGDEGGVWVDEKKVTCEKLYSNGESVEILGSFNAG